MKDTTNGCDDDTCASVPHQNQGLLTLSAAHGACGKSRDDRRRSARDFRPSMLRMDNAYQGIGGTGHTGLDRICVEVSLTV